MSLLFNNLKTLLIHAVMTVFSFILVMLYVAYSPNYSSKFMATILALLLYIACILTYVGFGKSLKLESYKRKDYLVGILTFIIGLCLWLFTIYYSKGEILSVSKDLSHYWIPYNMYIFPSWLLFYGQSNTLVLLIGSVFPGLLVTLGMKLKRYSINKVNVQ